MGSVVGGESDEVLLGLYKRGDAEALAELVSRYQSRLFSFILNMAGHSDEADDIFQEVWLRAIDKIDSYKEKSFLAWLTKIAHNLMIDRWRGRKPTISLDAMEDEGGLDTSGRLPGAERSPAGHAEMSDLAESISAAVAALPLDQREVFLMRAKEGLSFKEIAAIQGVSINTALARMHYGLAKLRNMLDEEVTRPRES